MKGWQEMTNHEKMKHILETPIGSVPCDEDCTKCPIGNFKECGDDKAYNRAKRWLAKNTEQQVPSDQDRWT